MDAKKLRKFLKQWIKDNYGMSEADNPCYNITKLAKDLEAFIKKDQTERVLSTLNPHQYFIGRK